VAVKALKWPWFLANVAVNAYQDLATLKRASVAILAVVAEEKM
jgi:hypothetical protein